MASRRPSGPPAGARAAAAVGSLCLGALLSGCQSLPDADPVLPEERAGAVEPSAPDPDPVENVPSALRDIHDPRLPTPTIDTADLVSGGPPPDGIPPIDNPVFRAASDTTWLSGDDPLLSLTVGGETRGYPLAVMTWHEIVNDTVGGVPVAVTYCPLCNSGVAFGRRLGERLLDFGTSGLLYADNLVMYDRQTESLWPQLTGAAVAGVLTGEELRAIPMGVVGWGQFRAEHPQALVLTRDTGHSRDYGRNPYVGYDDPDGALLADLPDEPDPRLPVKERVVGLGDDGEAVAVLRSLVADEGAFALEVAGRPVVLLHRPGQASALDAAAVAEGQEIGTVAAFRPRADGRSLTFQPTDDGFRDRQTGSTWTVTGRAVRGPLTGTQLTRVRHLDTFWFAWVAFRPDTALVQ